jgi:hypothetical protein
VRLESHQGDTPNGETQTPPRKVSASKISVSFATTLRVLAYFTETSVRFSVYQHVKDLTSSLELLFSAMLHPVISDVLLLNKTFGSLIKDATCRIYD